MLAELHEFFAQRTGRWRLPPIARPWFRGHEQLDWPLVPSILRHGNDVHEFPIAKRFRLLAPGFGIDVDTHRLDQWLFLMQHHGVPTRLLDWTESLNTAAFFACLDWLRRRDAGQCSDGAVVALNPVFLNQQVLGIEDFPVTWAPNPVLQTIKFAFGTQDEPVDGERIPYLQWPVAVFPSTIHGRMRAQKACFTLHGADRRDLRVLFEENGWSEHQALVEFEIPRDRKPELAEDLALAGTTYSTIFPDLQGLASDLAFQFRLKP